MKYVIAADVGATNLRVGLFTADGCLIKSVTTKTPREGGVDVVATFIYQLASDILKSVGIGTSEVSAIGVGSIGPLDIKVGDVVNAPNPPIRRFRLRRPLMELFNTDNVYVVNDCVAAVWGEKFFGAGRGRSNLVYLTISTGLGCGAIVNDELLLGKDGNAHEVGHVVVDYRGIECNCGGLGHWEGYVSGRGLPKFVAYYVKSLGINECESKLIKLIDAGELTSELFFKLVREGDKLAVKVVEELCRVNAAGLASVINVYDPELITIGGSVALNNYDLIIEPALKYLSKYVLNRPPEIMPTPLGHNAVLVGAATTAIKPPRNLLRIYGYV